MHFLVDNITFPHSRAHDTVGAVALDCAGNVACATSTGGIRNKMVGRVGDSPIIGMISLLALSRKAFLTFRKTSNLV